jgi:FKBP-type peptidyl-prolyl cis-trans isomerase 2
MTQAKNGDTVRVNYEGRLADGLVFDTTRDREPLEFIVGDGRLIHGFESAVLGMAPGESKTVELAPDEAYGPRRDDMIVAIDRGNIPADMTPEVGQRLQLQRPDGRPVQATVTAVSTSSVTVDANHPLAGHPLTFDIHLVEIGA